MFAEIERYPYKLISRFSSVFSSIPCVCWISAMYMYAGCGESEWDGLANKEYWESAWGFHDIFNTVVVSGSHIQDSARKMM